MSMTYEQKQAIRKLLQERQAMQAERREQAVIDREDEEVFQLFRQRGQVDPCDTTRSSIFVSAPAPAAMEAKWEPAEESDIVIYQREIPWDRIIVGLVYAASILMAFTMVMGWLL